MTVIERAACWLHRATLAGHRFTRRRLEHAVERCERNGCDTSEVRRYMAEHPVEGM